MSGLIAKDLFTIKKSYIQNLFWAVTINLFCMMLAVGSVYGNFKGELNFSTILYVSCFTPFFVGTASFVSFFYNRESGFINYEKTLPVTDEKKILSKYTVAGLCLFSSVFYIIIPILCCVLTNQKIDKNFIFVFIIAMELTAIFICIMLPSIYKADGMKTVRMVVGLAIMFLGMGTAFLYSAVLSFAEMTDKVINKITNNIEIFTLILLCICLVVFAISYKLSVKVYKRKRGVTK